METGFGEGQTPEAVIQKLDGLVFSMSEENTLTIVDVSSRAARAFAMNAEKVTRSFYRRFSEELEKFQEFIIGLRGEVNQKQYATLMLNRLMFIYFIQKKRFLNGEVDYLNKRLDSCKKELGKDKFYDKFYRDFLMDLFHRGLAVPIESRSLEIKRMIGNVPYLNGGLFDQHALEKEYDAKIEIADAAFKNLFDFFDQYNWHLDNSVTASGKDINPDVIGYIFEKYINKRAELGAYYTQEDITGYIARNTILPHLLRKTKEAYPNAFNKENGIIWRLLRENPEQYIYGDVQCGCQLDNKEIPCKIADGLDSAAPNLLTRRQYWNDIAPNNFALPTETWRETIARRKRFFALKNKLANGEVTDIADLITHNLDIEKLIFDTLQENDSKFISEFYAAIAGRQKQEDKNLIARQRITILDPACGSGAFLFAALGVLERLYTVCIKRMREFVEKDDINIKQNNCIRSHEFFRRELDEMAIHKNEEYSICRNIILNNLFGVDLMPEAVEVAKLRLFLKLAASAEMDDTKPNMGLEPLPDIDFNIRTGNSLLGFFSMEDFTKQNGEWLRYIDDQGIKSKAANIGGAYSHFIDAQNGGVISDIGSAEFKNKKSKLKNDLEILNEELNKYLGKLYGVSQEIDKPPSKKLIDWQQANKPFYWATEFYEIMEEGGFDVVIGNPPYVELSKVTHGLGNFSFATGNLYAFFIEKSMQLVKKSGDVGMIVPISLPSTKRMGETRKFLINNFSSVYASNFADRPGTLFNGVHQKTTIVLCNNDTKGGFYTTNFMHWYAHKNRNERKSLFSRLHYQKNHNSLHVWAKFGNDIELSICKKIAASKATIYPLRSAESNSSFYLNKRLMYWVKCFVTPKKSNEFKCWRAVNMPPTVLVAIFNSNVFFWFWETISDGWDLMKTDIAAFKFGVREEDVNILTSLAQKLEEDLEAKKGYVGTVQTDYEYYHSKSKAIIDEIDKILAKHYDFSEEELDYIINYDYKYRMVGAE